MNEEGEDADHDEDDMGMEGEEAVTLEPGESAELTHTFDEAGTTYIACHEPGHYDAGMIVEVTVT